MTLRPWYGGHYGGDYDNFYDLFSASGMDFVIISLEYDVTANPTVLTWADSVLQAFPNRRGILVSHYILNADTSFGAQGQAIYNALKANANLDLMLCGHVPGESHRTDVFNGNTCHSILADYQSYTNGGNGWLRIMEFNPGTNRINIKSYSPYLNQYETDASSQYSLNYDMTGNANPYMLIGSDTITSGDTASVQWNTLMADSTYEWYAVVYDSAGSTTGTVNTFSTFASASSLIATACNSYTLNAQTYTSSGTYSQHFTNAVGCDSTLTINLTINNASSNSISPTTCDSYTLNSQTYTSSGTYTQHFTNAVGCDSALTINLTITTATSTSISASACDTYTLNAQTYTSSGVYTQTLTNANGCDSTLTINLTITTATSNSMSAFACDSYTLNAQTYTNTGAYTQTLVNTEGCDSLLTINLTIKTSPTVTYTQSPSTVCENWAPFALAGGSPSGGTYVGTGVTANTFDPGAAGAGTFPIQYSYTDVNGCSATQGSSITVDACTGVNPSVTMNEEIIIYPNPTTGQFQISNFRFQIESIKIMNVLWEIVYQSDNLLGLTLINVDICKEPIGVYFIELQTGNSILRNKIIKQ